MKKKVSIELSKISTIKQIFDAILTGNKDEAKDVASAVRKNIFGGRKKE